MINLTENDKDIIRHLGYPKAVKLSSGSFYIKLVGPERGLKEMLGVEIATQMGLITPISSIAMIDGFEYLISEDLNRYGEFINAEDMEIGDLIEEYCSIEEAKDILENKYYIGDEINNLIKIYIFDIIFKHFDRNKRNWGLITLPDGSKRLVILDNEYLLVDNDKKEKIKLYFSKTMPLSLEEDFLYFLHNCKPEEFMLFIYYFNLYTPEFITSLINNLIKRNNLIFNEGEKEEIIESYVHHYLKLQETIIKETNKESKATR